MSTSKEGAVGKNEGWGEDLIRNHFMLAREKSQLEEEVKRLEKANIELMEELRQSKEMSDHIAKEYRDKNKDLSESVLTLEKEIDRLKCELGAKESGGILKKFFRV